MAVRTMNMERLTETYSQSLYPRGDDNFQGARGGHREGRSLQMISSEQCAEVLQLQPKHQSSGKHGMYQDRGPYNPQMEKLRQMSQSSPPVVSRSLDSVSGSNTPVASGSVSEPIEQVSQDFHTGLSEKHSTYQQSLGPQTSRDHILSQAIRENILSQSSRDSLLTQTSEGQHRVISQAQQQRQHDSPHTTNTNSPNLLMNKQTISYPAESSSQDSQQKNKNTPFTGISTSQAASSHEMAQVTSGQSTSRPGRKPKSASAQPGDGTLLGELQMDPSQRPVTSEKTCVCMVCFKLFRNKPQLTQHELVHNGIRKHSCAYCDKSFKQLCHLQQHIRIHTGERPYRCNMENCHRSFAQLSNLQHHLRNHDEHVRRDSAKQYRCMICDRSYTTESSLRAHSLKLHVNVKPLDPAIILPQKKKRKKKSSGALPPDPQQTIVVDISSSDDDMPSASSGSSEHARTGQFSGNFISSSTVFSPQSSVSSHSAPSKNPLEQAASGSSQQKTHKEPSSGLPSPLESLAEGQFGSPYQSLPHPQLMPPALQTGQLGHSHSQAGPMGVPFLGPSIGHFPQPRVAPPGQPWPLYVSSESSFLPKPSDRRQVMSSPQDFRIAPSPSSAASLVTSSPTVSTGQP